MLIVPADYSATQSFNTTTYLPFITMISVILLFDCAFPFVIDYFEKVENRNTENEKALLLFQNISDDLTGLSGFSVCSNETINTIFYTKIQQAKAANIKFTVNIDENYAILIDEYDLCRILCNLIDNALNATKLSNLDKLCNFYLTINEDYLIIESKNNFTSAKQSKPDKSALHGNGIGIIKEIISKYDGTYLAKQECNVWFTEVKLKNKANKAVETG